METKNVNLVTGSNVEGNIGSCTTKNEKVLQYGGFWREKGVNIATNSCSGLVEKYPYTDFSIGATVSILLVVLVLGFMFGSSN